MAIGETGRARGWLREGLQQGVHGSSGVVVILVGSLIVHVVRGTLSRHGEAPVTWA